MLVQFVCWLQSPQEAIQEMKITLTHTQRREEMEKDDKWHFIPLKSLGYAWGYSNTHRKAHLFAHKALKHFKTFLKKFMGAFWWAFRGPEAHVELSMRAAQQSL